MALADMALADMALADMARRREGGLAGGSILRYTPGMSRDPPTIKICGINAAEALTAALDAGAEMVGFVFFPPSPRHVTFEAARELGRRVEGRARKVALTVDAEDRTLDLIVEALAPDLLQLHGSETPLRTAAVRARYGLPVMKAIGVASASDLTGIQAYVGVADKILLDAKPAPGALRPGGNGLSFDWRLVSGFTHAGGWLLSGGLDAGNVAEALAQSGAPGIDISSGVERAPGVKDPRLVAEFVAAARAARRDHSDAFPR